MHAPKESRRSGLRQMEAGDRQGARGRMRDSRVTKGALVSRPRATANSDARAWRGLHTLTGIFLVSLSLQDARPRMLLAHNLQSSLGP